MGKKGKKKSGGKSGKRKSGKKKSGSASDQMTFKEAMLGYQISIKEKSIEEFMFEIKQLEEKNQRHKERNERLKEEQMYHIKTLLKQAKEREKELEDATVIGKEQVEAAMKENWKIAKEEEKKLIELRDAIQAMDKKLEDTAKEVTKWEEYRNSGQHKHATQIKILEQELVDMQSSFDEMKAHLEKTLEKAKTEIGKTTEGKLNSQKEIASDKAMKTLDKWSAQEVMDNDWLKKEAVIHREETVKLKEYVEQLEKENLEIMSELFECRVDDLKISRNFYLTQFEDSDNLDEGILEMDLSTINFKDDPGEKMLAIQAPPSVRSDDVASTASSKGARPKSATQRAVEHKVFSISTVAEESEEESDEDREHYDEDYDGDDDLTEEEKLAADAFLDNYFQLEDEDYDDFLKLGPLELKLLSVTGTAKPLHKQKKMTSEEADAKASAPDEWPVSRDMLQQAVRAET
ncbi:coiled-coil domain-containing protein 83-like [Ptychodera flava]|uniref:coiled-coil domain-containing protein 83-like n=1 Tax=Ptychodera flava TaxID=63121 RepID=UPI00396A10D6